MSLKYLNLPGNARDRLELYHGQGTYHFLVNAIRRRLYRYEPLVELRRQLQLDAWELAPYTFHDGILF